MMERKLDIVERFFWLLGRVVSTNFAAHARIIGPLDDDQIRAALNAVQARHPLLRMGVVRSGWVGAKFVEMSGKPIPMAAIKADDWIPIAEQELRREFKDGEAPLIRCVRVIHGHEESTLIITFHHVIGDGISAAWVLRDLLAAIRQGLKGEAPHLEALSLLPGAHKGYPWYTKFPFSLPLYLFLALRFITCMPLSLFVNGPSRRSLLSRFRGRTPCLISRKLEPDIVMGIADRAKQERTTIHGALMAALMKAIAKQRNLPFPLRLSIASPVNLRDQLTPPVGEDTGVFVTIGISINTIFKNMGLWTLARRARRSLVWAIARKEAFVFPVFFQSAAWLLYLFGVSRIGAELYIRYLYLTAAPGIPLSNIGRVQIDSGGDVLTVQELGFYATVAALSHFAVFAATIGDRMTLNFNFLEPVLSRQTVEDVADLMIEELSFNV